jgi:type III pantothenate kinase
VRTPQTVGRDRLYAARGALEWTGRAAVVIDAGTALTVDAVRPLDDGPFAGAFLGGAIAPGPALLADALARGGALLPRVEPELDVPALGRDTPSALRAGIAVGFAGAARELAARVAAEAGLGGAPIVLTGGARAYVRDVLLDDFEVLEDEHLVHRGLAAAVRGVR